MNRALSVSIVSRYNGEWDFAKLSPYYCPYIIEEGDIVSFRYSEGAQDSVKFLPGDKLIIDGKECIVTNVNYDIRAVTGTIA